MSFSRLAPRGLLSVSALVLSLLIAALALLWGLGHPRVFTWVAERAASFSGARLALHDVRGELWNRVYIGSLRYEDSDRIVTLAALNLDWDGKGLLQRHLRVERLQWEQARYEAKSTDRAPPPLPSSLRLPFDIRINNIGGPLTLVHAGVPFVFERIALKVEQTGDLYHVRLDRLETPFGKLDGSVTLAADRPFDLAGRLAVRGARTDIRYVGGFSLSGALDRIGVVGTVDAERQRIKAHAVLTPFSVNAMRSFNVQAFGFDPSSWRKEWPQAQIDFESAGAFAEQGTVRATFALRNRLPGRIDEARIPLRTASGIASGTSERGAFTGVAIDFGKAGAFGGSGGWTNDSWRLLLETSRLDLNAVHKQLASSRLKGALSLSGDKRSQRLSAKLTQPGYALALGAARTGDRLDITDAQLVAHTAKLGATGQMDLIGQRSFTMAARLSHFDPRRFGDFPKADISADIDAHGTLADRPSARAVFKIVNSTLRGFPLTGRADIAVAGSRISRGNIDLLVAGNRIRARGSMGGSGDRLSFDIDAPHLGRLGASFAGTLRATGVVAGDWLEPSLRASVAARNLRALDAYRADRVTAKIDLALQADAPFQIEASARGLGANTIQLDTMRIRSQGRTESHRIEVVLNGPRVDMSLAANGGWRKSTGWSGRVQRFHSRAPVRVELAAPAALQIAPARVALRGAALRIAQGTLLLQSASWRKGVLETEGRASALSVQAVMTALRQPSADQFPLVVNAAWNLRITEEISGFAQLSRQSGDIVLKRPRTFPLRLTTLDVGVQARRGTVTTAVTLAGERVGRVAGDVTTRLARQGGRWGLPGAAPLSGTLSARSNSIAWLSAFTTDAIMLDGALNASINFGGTVSEPLLRGTAAGDRLKVSLVEYGVNLKEGRLRADFSGDQIAMRQLVFQAGAGTLEASGSVGINNNLPDAALRWTARSVEVLSSAERQLIVSGNGTVRLVDKQISVIGQLTADRGIIELPDANVRKLSPDIVVLGRTEEARPKPVPYAVRLELSVDLGERFVAKGRGLDAKLSGRVNITAAGGDRPRALGSIRIEDGSYTVYGRKLDLDRGTINFAGPIDNPAIHVVARRKTVQVDAGVEVSGTLDKPIVRLISTPPMQDAEILSWLVLGHGIGDISGSEVGLLQTAAGALLARGQSTTLQAKVAAATGLDEVSIEGGGSEFSGAVVTLGKQLSDRLYLTYEQGLATSANLLSLRYQLSPRLSLRLQGGSDNAIDLFYSFSYD